MVRVAVQVIFATMSLVLFSWSGVRGEGSPLSDFQVTFGAGWGQADQDDLNDKYIDDFARPAGLLDDRLSSRASFYGELAYSLPPKHQLLLGLSYTGGKTDNHRTELITDESQQVIGTMTASNELSVSAIIPHARFKYFISRGTWSPFVSLGAAYVFGKANLEQEVVVDSSQATLWSQEDKYTGRGWGWLVTMGIQRNLAGPVSVGAEGGYRQIVTSDLEDDAGAVWRFDGARPAQAVRLDFSGWYLLATVTVDIL
jgi:opacity protein-like surface antigen